MKIEKVSIRGNAEEPVYVITEKYKESDKEQSSACKSKGSLKSEQYKQVILKEEFARREKLARIRTKNRRRLEIFPVPKWVAEDDTVKKKPQPKTKHTLHHVVQYHGVRLSRIFNLSQSECSVLVHIFWKISEGTMTITGDQFKNFFITTFNCCYRKQIMIRGYERYRDIHVGVTEFVKLCVVMLRGSLIEKAKFVFEIYDLNGCGYITRDELTSLLNDSFDTPQAANILGFADERPVFDSVEFLMTKMDKTKHGKVYCKDFVNFVLENPLLLECCCDVFATEDYIQLFKVMLFNY